MTLTIEPIGSIRTAHHDRRSTPVQSALNTSERGEVTLFPDYWDGLAELDGFDFAWLLTWFEPDPGDPVPVRMRQVPFLLTGGSSSERREIGLFAMRGPRRPNPIGLHLVRIVSVSQDGFTFAGVDMVDQTPLLDVKPWVAHFDVPHGNALIGPVRSGWFDTVDLSGPHTPESLARRDHPSS